MGQEKEIKGNYAFIDGQNLYQALLELGWKMDYGRFRQYLKDKYGVEKAFYCIGYLPTNTEPLYPSSKCWVRTDIQTHA